MSQDGASELLRMIRGDGPCCIVAIYPDPDSPRLPGDEERNAVTRVARTEAEAQAFIGKYDGKANLHFTVNPLRWDAVREKPGSDLLTAVTHLHVDIDCGEAGKADALQRLQGFDAPGSPSIVIDSGGGLQAIWRLNRPIDDIEAAKAMNRALVHALDGDPQCVNPVHLLRLPGTVNLPNAKKRERGRVPGPARLLRIDKERAWSAESFVRAEAPSGDTDYAFAPESVDDLSALNLPPRLVEIITDGRAKGETLDGDDSRSAWAFHAAKELVKHGLPVPVIAGILLSPDLEISAYVLDRDDSEREAIRTTARARASVIEWERMQREKAIERLPAETTESQGAEAPQLKRGLEWNTEGAKTGDSFDFIEGVFMEGQVSLIVGPSFVGKTYFVADAAMHVATGRPWHGRDVQQGGVIYVALEGATGLHRRVAAWRKYHDFNERPLPLFIMQGALDLRKDRSAIGDIVEAAAALKQKRGHGPAWIIVDTLAHAMAGGSERADEDMNALYAGSEILQRAVRAATGSNVHVSLVHQTGWTETQRMRGSSVLFGNIYTELVISAAEDGLRIAKITKQKDSEAGAEFGFRIVPVELDGRDRRGNPLRSAVAVRADLAAFDALTAWQQHWPTIARMIEEGRPDGLPWSVAGRAKREYRLNVALAAELVVSEKDAAAILDAAEAAGVIRRGTFSSSNRNKYEAWLPPDRANNE